MKKHFLIILFHLIIITVSAQVIDKPIRFKNGTISASKNLNNEKNITDALNRVHYKSKYYVLIQFDKLPGLAERQALALDGIVLFDYIPANTFLAEVEDTFKPTSFKKHTLSGFFTMEPLAKISTALLQQLKEPATGADTLIAVNFFGSIDKGTAISELKLAGAHVVDTRIQSPKVIFIEASGVVVQKISLLPFVVYISSQVMKDIPINYASNAVHGVNSMSASAGRNLKGYNVTLGIGDNADASTHLDFSGRLINRFPLTPAAHGTHTTGTMAGAGLVNPKHKGMAPKATIISQFYSDILVNTPFYMTDHKMVLTNNSYFSGLSGCPGEGDYDVLSNYVDAQLNNNPSLLHVFASGNDGTLTCSPNPAFYATIKSGFQCGKNVLTVGAISTNNYTVSNFSSRGPVDDGRLKPEIVAGGSSIVSCIPNNAYGTNFGTSMAAPAVTGSLALLYERYRQLNGGADPSGALIKAFACNGADDLGNPGPDFAYGFGSLNVRNAVEAIEGNQYFRNSITNNTTITHTITGVPAGAEQIKIMLYWNDPAASPYTATTLVNNLDLSVKAPDASIHYPLLLNPNSASVNNVAIEGVDNTNNIEQVVIKNPAAGDFTITVSGTGIPSGPQDYVVVYSVIQPSVTIEYPFGEETWVPGESETIRWSAFGSNTNTFTVEYSLNNGIDWILINNNIPATSRSLVWVVPNTPSNNGMIRVSRNGTVFTDVNDYNFSILGQPTLTLTNTCPGYAQLSWGAIASATEYEIMVLNGDSMQKVATTTSTSYLLEALNKDSACWLSVRAKNSTTPGRRSIAKMIIPGSGTCTSPIFDNDFSPELIVAPVTGRLFTSSQLGVAAPQVRIRNLGNTPSSGSFTVSYQVNGNPVVTESSTQSIAASSTYNYTFTSTFDFSIRGKYIIKVWVDYSSDMLHRNDTLVTVVKHLQNDPVILNPSYTEGFETATVQTYHSGTLGFEGLNGYDFRASNNNGRARTFVNTGMARTGNRAITLDQKSFSATSSADSLIATLNLSNYSENDQLWLDFYYQNQGTDFLLPGNQVWIRGSENDAWIPVFTLPANDPNDFGNYRSSAPVNITENLSNAIIAQKVSSSFQIKFGQQGYTSTNSIIPDGNLDDGFTFDDVMLTLAKNDVAMQRVVSPDMNNICALSRAESFSVQVKNYSTTTLSNISISYNINGSTVTENIASLAGGQVQTYTFIQKADLSPYQTYTIKTWVHHKDDNYAKNDTLTYTFTTVPVITSFPYLEGFEANNGYWYTAGINSSWQWGTPAKTIINKAANGSRVWVTSLTGNYNNGELSYLYSPCFDLSKLAQPVLSFSHIFRTEDDCDCDFHWVEYSTDGATWLKLGTTGNGTNWYDHAINKSWKTSSTRWQVSSYDIPAAGNSVRFRFVMSGDPAATYEGVGIDDIHVFDKAAIYSGANITTGLTKSITGNNWIHFDLDGKRIASINPNGQNLGNTAVKVYISTSQVRNNGYQYYLDRNLVIQPAIVPSGPVSVRYYFRNSEVNNMIRATGCINCHNISDAYVSGITQYSDDPAAENGILSDDSIGTFRFITPAQINVIPYDNGYYAEYRVNNFSEFWINSGGPGQNQALPQIVDSFRVTKNDETALLQWRTLQEINTDKFIVERSGDGISYTVIDEVLASGKSTSIKEYQFTDRNLLWGLNYYRIKIMNTIGGFVYSPVRKINHTGNKLLINVYPNPVNKGVLYITATSNCTRIELRDVLGRMTTSVNVQGTHNQLSVNHIARGTYFLTVFTDAGNRVEKVLIE